MNELNIPPGQATGCLPRTTKYGECCAKLEDEFNIIPDKDIVALHINAPYDDRLLSSVWVWLSQGSVGSCGAEAATNAVMLAREFCGAPRVELNPWSVYQHTSGGRDRGSSVGENMRRIVDVGILPMDVWPREKGWKQEPPQEMLEGVACKYRAHEWLDINSIAEMKTALTLNFPVPFGWRGHSCVLVALRDLKSAYYLNSWGKDWAANEHDWPGIGVINLKDVDLAYEAWALRTVVYASTKGNE